MKKIKIDTGDTLYMVTEDSTNAMRAVARYDLPVTLYSRDNQYLLCIGGNYVQYFDRDVAIANFNVITQLFDILVRSTLR